MRLASSWQLKCLIVLDSLQIIAMKEASDYDDDEKKPLVALF